MTEPSSIEYDPQLNVSWFASQAIQLEHATNSGQETAPFSNNILWLISDRPNQRVPEEGEPSQAMREVWLMSAAMDVGLTLSPAARQTFANDFSELLQRADSKKLRDSELWLSELSPENREQLKTAVSSEFLEEMVGTADDKVVKPTLDSHLDYGWRDQKLDAEFAELVAKSLERNASNQVTGEEDTTDVTHEDDGRQDYDFRPPETEPKTLEEMSASEFEDYLRFEALKPVTQLRQEATKIETAMDKNLLLKNIYIESLQPVLDIQEQKLTDREAIYQKLNESDMILSSSGLMDEVLDAVKQARDFYIYDNVAMHLVQAKQVPNFAAVKLAKDIIEEWSSSLESLHMMSHGMDLVIFHVLTQTTSSLEREKIMLGNLASTQQINYKIREIVESQLGSYQPPSEKNNE